MSNQVHCTIQHTYIFTCAEPCEKSHINCYIFSTQIHYRRRFIHMANFQYSRLPSPSQTNMAVYFTLLGSPEFISLSRKVFFFSSPFHWTSFQISINRGLKQIQKYFPPTVAIYLLLNPSDQDRRIET